MSSPSSILPPGIPLSQLYDSGHHDTVAPPPPPAAATGAGSGYHVKSGTQLLDFCEFMNDYNIHVESRVCE